MGQANILYCALRQCTESPFMYLFKSGNDQALLNACAVDHVVFIHLLHLFKLIVHQYMINEKTTSVCLLQATFSSYLSPN